MKESAMTVEDRIRELGLTLPNPTQPVANYVGAVQAGNLVFVSGHGPRGAAGERPVGKVGRELTREQGYDAARLCILGCLSSLKTVIGDLDRVRRVVKLLCMVNCTEEFTEQPQVANGASDLLVEIFGDRGKHARSAVGMQMLPSNIPVEIEMIVEVD
jgi:enamine deaminase RidA (YjgF/YER057c/UK114 family)